MGTQLPARLEDGWGRGNAGTDARLEVAADAGGDGDGAALGVEALEVEVEALGALPEMRIVDMAAVLVQRVDHLEETALQARGLSGCMQRRRARVLAGHGEVTEDDRRLALGDLSPRRGAVRAAEIRVDDQARPTPTKVIIGPLRGNGCASQVGQNRCPWRN